MQTIFAAQARTPAGWQQGLRLCIEDGIITRLDTGCTPRAGDLRVDTLLPGLANLHSHSFQRAMAGMNEHRAEGRDSFWTWRALMYRFLDHLTPEQMQAIATLTFMEMLEAGYTAVGEFHYVHHQPGGAPYASRAELSQRIFAAAAETGIGLTHLPVLYSYGGAGRQPLAGGQLRFGNSGAEYADLVEQIRSLAHRNLPADTVVGIAPHSLRATCPEDLRDVLALQDGVPLHIHIAEQPAEVADITGWLGARPVEWLLQNAPVDPKWCLIHATHMTEAETRALAHSGAVAGLCPITEANLGDGPFNGAAYLSHGGRFGIGSDSNLRIALPEELRLLEYSQRLRDLCRNVMVPGPGSVGESLYLGAAEGGAQALGRTAGRIEPGALADLVAIDSTHPALCALDPAQLLDGLCFAAGEGTVTDVWSAGRHQVKEGRHLARDRILAAYRQAMADLRAAL
ncbi:formimidoylglutamate deiminase [Phaeobacter sp. QD34_3]|uniref:formimidoylglutamate deiminase n=1 Tax=unclassified Phaeobacter TaxID=2621772 RepID=UPI00237FD4A1|nr:MULTISPECIES: formimidoylglutamate deiminase [unclassified Phaeobacter]MDE4134580.1 formimidoylglutamate deiminase [Phaeobacter sp. QD34_3]MDE4138239.1 formimidoylglutamate deiminase [Phaeobacter sp. QD34_24]MDE4172987.1 formimidoylglutamate deiminase [Phaeobacter sp. PT47_59]